MNKYLKCFDQALEGYQQQTQRPGYEFGWFSGIRHSKKLYPHVATLLQNLTTCSSDEDAQRILQTYFTSPQTKLNNHSFGTYLLDQLANDYPEENWEHYYPKEKQIQFYTGTVYRGSLQPFEDAFANGMIGEKSKKIEDYANDTNMHTGVSTSKDLDVAKKYQVSAFQTSKGAYFEVGNCYEINYRDHGGVDIIGTLTLRGKDFVAALAAHKDEVNIIGKIKPEDIIGCWDKKGDYHKNAAYVKHKKPEPVKSFPARMSSLFPSVAAKKTQDKQTDQLAHTTSLKISKE